MTSPPARRTGRRGADQSATDQRSTDQRSSDQQGAESAGTRSMDPARSAALELLSAVREDGAYANLALPRILAERRLESRDAGLATELAYGTCRSLGLLDLILGRCVDRPLAHLDGPVHDVLRLGAYQLLRTRIPPHAAVSTSVELVRAGPRSGAAGFVNAVLRKVAARDEAAWVDLLAPSRDTDRVGRAAIATSHPRWIAAAFDDALGDRNGELEQALAADDLRPRVHLVARPGRISRDELIEASGGVPARYSAYGVYLDEGDPGRIGAIANGRAAVQDEGSQLVAVALADVELDGSDGRWLDLAAGPGGKAGLLGALAAQRGAVVDAVEVSRHRAELVRQTTRGLPVTVTVADGRDPDLAGDYDRVLLDAPCTGLGALRRRPDARWRRTAADVEPLVTLQRQLLASATALVRVGGVVGYVTCSPHLSETLGVVGTVGTVDTVDARFTRLDAREYLPGVPDLGDGPTVQLWPHRHGTDGMFLALLRRDS